LISFRFCGTKVCLHFSFFAVLCLCLQLGGGSQHWITAALLHEAGHLLAFAVQKTPPRELHFQLGGIRLVPPDDPLPFLGELLTLAGGGIVSLFCAGLGGETALPHLFTGLFSLMPVPGLDGGEIFSLLWSRSFPGKEQKGRQSLCLLAAVLSVCFLCRGLRRRSPEWITAAAGILLAWITSIK